MIRRSLAAALWLIAGLLASFLGALSALVGTGAGRQLLAHVATSALKGAVDGSVEIGEISGPLFTGVTLHDVKIFGLDTTLVAAFQSVDANYNPFDFAAGRFVLVDVTLHQPVINLVEHPNGRLNLEDLLRLGRPSKGPQGPAALILFRNARITDGTVTLRLQERGPPGDPRYEIDPLEQEGRHRVHRFEHLDARLPLLRISSPQERGIRAQIAQLSVRSTDPEVELIDVSGGITVVGDSLFTDLRRVELPHSRLSGRGSVRWPHGPLLFDLAIRADSATLGDVPFLDLKFPPEAVLRGGLRLRSHGERLLEIQFIPVDVHYGGGTLTGHVTAVTAPDSGLVALRAGDLTANDFDLDFVRRVIPGFPFYGRMTGHATTDGTMHKLTLDLDAAFRDSLVSGWPLSHLRGKGQVDLLDPEGMAFHPFVLDSTALDLGTVRRLVPGVVLRGQVTASGVLTGTLHNTAFSGSLVHRDAERPPSALFGAVGLDTRGDTTVFSVDARAESLSLEDLRGSYPDLRLHGTLFGPVRLSGTLGSLDTHLDLESASGAGHVRLDGRLTLLDSRIGARDLTFEGRQLDFARWLPTAPESRVNVRLAGSLSQDDSAPPIGTVAVVLGPSLLVGTEFDSGQAQLRFADGHMYVDSLRLAEPGIVTTASGSLGWRRPERGVLSFTINADSLNGLDSLLARFAGPDTASDKASRSLRGSAHLLVALDGALDSTALEARGSTEHVQWRNWEITAARGRGTFEPGTVPRFDVGTAVDSLRYGTYGFGAVSASATGTTDSLHWFARSRLGDVSAFLAGGRFSRQRMAPGDAPTATLAVDSLAVLLPGGVWALSGPTSASLSDSAVRVNELTLKSLEDSGRVTLVGDFPKRGSATAHLQLDGFPLAGLYALLRQDTTGIAGTLTATLGLSGTRTAPLYQGSLSLSNATLGEFRMPYVDGTFGYRDQRLDASLHLWRAGQQILTVTSRLPLDLSLTSVAQRQLPDTLSVRAQADSVDLSVLGALTTLVRDVRGVFSADVGIGGTWSSPRLEGGLQIAGGGATIPALNVRYDSIGGQFALSGDTLQVRNLSARSDKGRLDVGGFVRLENLTHPVLGLQITGDHFRALDLKGNVTVTASGRLSLVGPVFGSLLTGHATVTSGVLYFADLLEKRIVNLQELGDTALASVIEQQGLGPEFQSVFLDQLRIGSLNLEMGSDVWLRSSEANIQLSGSVTLSKEGQNYLLSGTLQAPRGTYRLKVGPVTREFVVSQGTVKYFGTPDLDADLDIEAKHTVHPIATQGRPSGDITVVAHITGTLAVPKVTLAAERGDYSETEVISYLMFGTPSPDPNVGDQQALLTAVAAVSGAVSGELERTLVSDLGIPLDYVEIRPGSATDPFSGVQLALGRQLGSKTFVVVNAGFCQGRQIAVGNTIGLSLQFRISPEFRTEASFEPVRNCSADPFFDQTVTVPRQIGFDLIWERRY